jgi:putative sigma-54 modulation protein
VDVSVSSRNIELTEALRSAAEEKVGRLSRFLDGMDRAQVHFFEERNPRIADKDVCEVTLEGHGYHVRAKVAAADPFAAIDAVVAKLEHQLHKLKTKLLSRNHPKGGRPDVVAKSKSFVIEPMTPEEAILQMDLLNHDFFFFNNSETGRSGVVYRRRSGDVGLIDDAG